MADKQSLYQEFCELGKEQGLCLDTFTVNGHFVKFTNRETDNIWLGFCLARGGQDLFARAIARSSQESIDKLLGVA